MKKYFVSITAILLSLLIISGCGPLPPLFIGWGYRPTNQPPAKWVCKELNMYFVVQKTLAGFKTTGELITAERTVNISVHFESRGIGSGGDISISDPTPDYGDFIFGGSCKFKKDSFTVIISSIRDNKLVDASMMGKEITFVKEKIE